jgi:hypothetical protein
VVAWAWKGRFVEIMRAHANERSDWRLGAWWKVIVRWVAPIFLLALIAWTLSDFVADMPTRDALGFVRTNWVLHLIGHVLFAAIPVVFLLIVSRKPVHGDEPAGEKKSGALWPVLALPGGAAAIGVLWGTGRLVRTRQVARAAEAAATDVAQSGELIEKVVGFQPHDLGVASFITLSIAFLTILGGLIWCFSRAMAAAGSGDVELPEESN